MLPKTRQLLPALFADGLVVDSVNYVDVSKPAET